jgi:CBS domain-containing protein
MWFDINAGKRQRQQQQQRGSSLGYWPLLLGGIGVGSALTYLLDPALGRTRRARTLDKLVHATHVGSRDVRRAERVVANRAQGLLSRLRAALRPEEAVDDVVMERVRSTLGRICSHASAIDAAVAGGEVVLSGPVLEREHARILRDVSRVRGVKAVYDKLERHVHPTNIPGLQGGRRGLSVGSGTRCLDLMKREVRTVGEDDTIYRAAELMTMANVGFLPVCDRQRKVVGTLTDRDVVVRVIAKERSAVTSRVGDVMSRDVVACRPDDDIAVAEQLMGQRQVSRLVITRDDGTLEGIISLSDIIKREPAHRAAGTLRAVANREAQRA